MFKKIITTLLIVAFLATSFPPRVFAANAVIRQEINIIDTTVTASGDDSALVQLDTSKYNGATYYFEVVGKVDSGTLTVALERVGTATQDATRTVTATSYTRVRSASFTPPASAQTVYNINLSGGTNPSVKAARIIIIQNATSITDTQTQIEIGNYETGKTSTSATALTNPKYWKYDSTKWDGAVAVSAEAVWKKTDTANAAAPTFVSAGSIASDTTGACAITPTPPTHVTDDILIASLWNSGGSKPTTATAGWNEINTIAGTEDATWYWKRATAAGTAGPSVTAADTDCFGIVYVFRGTITTGTPYEDNTTSGDGTTTDTTPDTATIDTTSTNRLAVGFLNHGDDIAFASGNPPSTWTADSNVLDGSGTDVGFSVISKTIASASTVSAVSFGTWSVGEAYGAVTLAFIPPIDTTPTVTITLQQDDGSFGSWADIGTIVESDPTSGTVTRTRAGPFALTSGRNYRLAGLISNGTGHTFDILNAKVIVDQFDLSLPTDSSQVTSYNTDGSNTFTTQSDVTSVVVELWGAGGGGTAAVGAGGGGAYAKSTVSVSASTGYNVTVGNSAINTDGGDTTFNTTTVVADGGLSGTNGSTGGTTANSTGDVEYAGGTGDRDGGGDSGGGGAGDSGAATGTTGGTPNGGYAGPSNSQGSPIAAGGSISSGGAQNQGDDGRAKITYTTAVGGGWGSGFPAVKGRSWGRNMTSSTSHSITMPSSIAADELLIIFFSTNATDAVIHSGGWTKLGLSSEATETTTLAVFYKKADGSDTATVTTNTSDTSVYTVLRVANGGVPSIVLNTGTSGNVDPSSLSPTGGSQKYLWLSAGVINDSTWGDDITAAPTNYNYSIVQPSGSALLGLMAIAERYNETATENPGAFTNSSETWVAANVAIPPLTTASVSSITKIQPQYLLLNTSDAGTGLQNFPTLWDSSEWNDSSGGLPTFYYAHSATNAADSSKLYDVTGAADVSGATVTGANQQISSSFTMPSSGDTLDTNVTVSTGVVGGVRILADWVLVVAAGTLKTAVGLAEASVKTFLGLSNASTKTKNGLSVP